MCQNIIRVLIVSLLLTIVTSISTHITVVHAQTSSDCYNGVVTPTSPAHGLPVILIHGYYEDSGVWSKWVPLLQQDGIPFCTVSFVHSFNPTYDECGSAADHANELSQIVQKVKEFTGENQVNIVGHSKGGLDARVYLEGGTHDVANLVMIGTPNAGSPLADLVVENSLAFTTNPYWGYFVNYWNSLCKPAVLDLQKS